MELMNIHYVVRLNHAYYTDRLRQAEAWRVARQAAGARPVHPSRVGRLLGAVATLLSTTAQMQIRGPALLR
jgi:hypothetical protein